MGEVAPSAAYLRRLLIFLCLVSFFDGYDLFAISQTLPELRAAFALTPTAGSRLLAVANLGTLFSYLLVRLADRWGRRPLLLLCLSGYSVASLLSAVAPEVVSFFVGQFLGRLFLVGALAMAVLYAAEEYPKDRRGRVIGIVQACYSFGAIACAAVTPRLLKTAAGWHAVYFLGTVSAALLFFAIPGLRETERFLRLKGQASPPPLLPRMLPPQHQKMMWKYAAIWTVTFLCTQSATMFWKEFARAERGMSNQQIGSSIAISAFSALLLTVLSGRLIDRIGRRLGAVVLYTTTALGVLGAYSQFSERLLVIPLTLLIAGATSAVALLNVWTAESFPTDLRGDSFGWANGLIGRVGFVLAPLLVAELVAPLGWARTFFAIAAVPILGLIFIWVWLPETAAKELEDSSHLSN